MSGVGTKLRALRFAAGLTAADVARAAGITPEHYRLLERGKHRPRPETLRAIAVALGADPNALLVEIEVVSTHHAECYRQHHRCAVARIDAAREYLRDVISDKNAGQVADAVLAILGGQ